MGDAQPRSTRFLKPDQAATLAALADRIFPAGDGLPAATELGVVEYLDGQLAGPWGSGENMYRGAPFVTPADSGHGWQLPHTPAEVYTQGLAALRQSALERFQQPFEQLDAARQDELIAALERDELATFADVPASAFFALLLAGVAEGLFSDPLYGGNRDAAAWRWIGYPGDVTAQAGPRP